MRETAVVDHPLPLLPPPVQPGDTIGLFCPAGPIRNMQAVEQGIACLQNLGFRVKCSRKFRQENDPNVYLAAADIDRAQELQSLWQDDEVAALMAVRGGFGCLRLLEFLDFSFIRTRPKLVVGFSDLTALLAAIHRQTGLIGLHGPVVSTLASIDRSSRQCLLARMTGDFSSRSGNSTMKILCPGTATGPLIVGNLTTLIHLIGTPYEPQFGEAILVLEDTGEPIYRIDRMLTQLAGAGKFNQLAGLIIGSFDTGQGVDFDEGQYQLLQERILELTAEKNCPVWSNFPLGHGEQNHALPYGMVASMEADGSLGLHPELARGMGERQK